MMMQIFGNCAVTFLAGRPSCPARPVAECGEIVFTNNEKTAFDIKYNGGGSPLAEFFGISSENGSISGTIGQGELNIKIIYDVPANTGEKYCLSDSYLGSNSSKLLEGVAKERCLDNPLPPQSIWTSQNKSALGIDYSGEIPENLRPTSVANIVSTPQLNMCLPPPILLDNVYFPTIRWSPLIKVDGDLLKAILNDGKDAIVWSKFSSATGKKDLIKKMSELAEKMVTIYVGAYDRKEYRLAWPQSRPLPQIYYNQELRDSIRIFPDIGFYTTTPMRWWDIAPSGRDYMHGVYQEVVDYLLDIALVRADHKVLTARDIYGYNYSIENENDVAVVISLDIEWQPTIVINSDKLPGGNVTHFWKRDLVGLMVPSYYACPNQ